MVVSWYVITFHIKTLSEASRGIERTVYTHGPSFVGLAFIKDCTNPVRANVEDSAQAAHIEMNSQTQRWGGAEDCKEPFTKNLARGPRLPKNSRDS